MSTRYPTPWKVEPSKSFYVFDANGHVVCNAVSQAAAAEIVNLANTAHAASENTRRFLERQGVEL